MPKKVFPGSYSSLAKIADFVIKQADSAGLNEKEIYQVQLAVDEACSNIIEHGYGGEGKGDIRIECKISTKGLEILLKDKGRKFNPDHVSEPKQGVPLDEVGYRGAGLFLMKKMMDEVNFEFQKQGVTILRMFKNKEH